MSGDQGSAFDDPVVIAKTVEAWRPIRARRLARESAHAAGDHSRCRPQDECQVELRSAS